MNAMRDRAKEHFPTVLLTLLSIVQALALELLWSHLRETAYLFELSFTMVMSWIQIIATFMGLVLIWVVYASNVMRFRWVPTTSESVYPFLIGLTEFMLIETLGPDDLGLWFAFIAVIFGMMFWVSHRTMQRARLDGENDEFFREFAPAKLRDFYPQIAIVVVLALVAVFLAVSEDKGMFSMLALLAINGLLVWQFYMAAQFWRHCVAPESDANSNPTH